MNPNRVACKIFVRGDPSAHVELSPFIGLFHRFIQEKALDGLLLDVADYAHVPDGPGVLLVGHDFDYGMDEGGSRVGLLTTRKRYGKLPLAEAVQGLLAAALRAADAIEGDADAGVRFATGALVIQVIDRLVAPNDAATFSKACGLLSPLLTAVYGEKHEVAHASAADPRQPLAIAVTAPDAPPAAELLARVRKLAKADGRTNAQEVAMPAQSRWDISVEDLKKLRDEGAEFVLLDVREPREYDICNLDGTLLPLGQLPQRIGELDRGAHVVVHCRSGGRSAKAVEILRAAGFDDAWNVNGGILAWIDRIDPSLTRY